MSETRCEGVMPAVLTLFDAEGNLDEERQREHVDWLIAEGVSGLVMTGTIGESASLTADEIATVTRTAVETADGRVPVFTGLAAQSLREVTEKIEVAEQAGTSGFMCLGPTTYAADWEELKAWFKGIAAATDRPLIVYNNPDIARCDLLPEQLGELAELVPNMVAIKESSPEVRRVAALRELLEGRVSILCGVDDVAMEAACIGADGWISGVTNVVPAASVELFEHARAGRLAEAWELNKRMLPLARLDVTSKLVHYYKRCLDEIGRYGGPCRPPRSHLSETEVAEVHRALEVFNGSAA